MNIQGFQQQNLGPAQQLLQHQQQQKQHQQSQNQTQLHFNDLFQSLNPNGVNVGGNNTNNNDGLNNAQLLAQTLYQGQFRSQTPQQRQIQLQQAQNVQPQIQQLQQQQHQQQQQQQQLQQQLQQQQQQQQQPQIQQQQQQQQQQPSLNHRAIQIDPQLTTSGHWKDQQQLVELSRKSNVPHFYARHAAVSSRKSKQPQFLDNSSKAPTLVEATRQLLDSDHNQNTFDSTNSHNSALLYNKKTSHDHGNDNDDDIDDNVIPRIQSKDFPEQLWGALDLSGQNIPNLSPNLFRYEFLTKLYLNGNNLSTIPKSIKNLKFLKILDLSNNNLSSLPLELGLLFNLKYLYLFDNNLQTLPFEFGNLFELNFLGIEGNPTFNKEYVKILASKGTKSLIMHLRDNVPKTSPPPKRQWIVLKDDDDIDSTETDNGQSDTTNQDGTSTSQDIPEKDSFTVLSYNILCHHYATAKLYNYTPSWALNWEYRRDLLKKQILEIDADVVCLQEVETLSFEDYWLPLMNEHGYRGIFHAKYRARRMNEKDAKKVDGCATFYKHNKFSLMERKPLEYTQIVLNSQRYKKSDDVFNRLQARDNIGLVTVLNHLETGQAILLANTHLHWDPLYNDVKTVQVGVLLEEIEIIGKRLTKSTHDSSSLKNLPVLICGDFNSQLHSAVYQLLANGFVKEHEDIDGRDYGKFTEVGFQHSFHLRSAYDNIGELPFTNFTPSFTDVLDYIWYTPSSLSIHGLLGKIDTEYLSHYVGLPNAHLPSDHVPLLTRFQLKQKRDIPKREIKAEFRSSRKT